MPTGIAPLIQEDLFITAEIKVYYDLYRPDAGETDSCLIALHGYGGSKAQMIREARGIAPSGFTVVSLQGFHQHLKEPK
jgi:predicted esterase